MGLLNALRRMGYGKEQMTVHGFRTTASTLLNEQGYNRDWIEAQLAHAERNVIRDAYNRAEYPAGATEDDAGVGRPFGRSESGGITA